MNSHHVNFNEVICRNLVFLANMYTDSTHVLEGCYGLLKMSCLAVYFLLNAARYISYLWVLDNFAFCAVWQKCMWNQPQCDVLCRITVNLDSSICILHIHSLDIHFSSNHNIHKSSLSLCFWASDTLIYRFY